MAGDLHGYSLRDPGSYHVPDCCAPEVMEDLRGHHDHLLVTLLVFEGDLPPLIILQDLAESSFDTSRIPCCPEIPYGFSIPVKHIWTSEMTVS